MSSDSYQTLSAPAYGEFRDRGSKFQAYAFPVESVDDCQNQLEEVKKLHPKARHWCYAYRLGFDGNTFRVNDDGEPSGTAGRPILGQIDSFELTNVLIVVVRYFGGTLLGTSGLINSYRTSAAEALKTAKPVSRLIENEFQLVFEYEHMSKVMNALKKLALRITEQDFGAIGRLKFTIPRSETPHKLLELKAQLAGVYLEEAKALESIEGITIKAL